MSIFVVSAAVLTVCACSTTRSDPRFRSIDWSTLEAQQSWSDPIAVVPEIDPFDLRIPLVTVARARVTGTGTTRHTVVDYPSSPVGVLFGNGLALDTEGNLFLDVIAMLKVDVRKDFDLRYGRVRLVHSGASFQMFTAMSLTTSITLSDTALTLKTGMGTWGYTLDGSTYRYASSGPLSTAYEVTAAENSVTLTVSALFSTTSAAITLAGQSAAFSPFYRVTKNGDAYHIEGLGDTSKSYTLSYAGSRIIFCEGEEVLKEIQIDRGSVLVDGRKVITFTGG
jgi:hypothetical protein